MYAYEFPKRGFWYSLQGISYANRIEINEEFIDMIAEFYTEADVVQFPANNAKFYNGAMKEVIKNLPPPTL